MPEAKNDRGLAGLTGKAGLVRVAESLGRGAPREQEDRLFLTRLANDPRHPMTPEMAEALLELPSSERIQTINEWYNAGSLPITPEVRGWMEARISPGPTGNDASSIVPEYAPAAGPVNMTDPQSTEASSGAVTAAASGYGVEEYLRLPFAAKRDAFVHDGFLYVRRPVLKEWFARLTPARCCPARRTTEAHSSDCWLGSLS